MAGINFTEDAARRISRVVVEAERSPRGEAGRTNGPRILQPSKYAIVTTAIKARSGTTLGQGVVDLQLVTVNGSGVATYATMTTLLPCYSGASSTIAVGRLVQVKVIDGHLHVDVDYC